MSRLLRIAIRCGDCNGSQEIRRILRAIPIPQPLADGAFLYRPRHCADRALFTFGKELVEETSKVFTLDLHENTVVLWLLTLIDMSLAGNLTLMVVFAGYENFVSRMDLEGNPDKPEWMGRVDFSNMKLKLIASIIAISVIHLLKSFMSIETTDKTQLVWLMMLHGVFLVSGIVLAAMDWLGERGSENKLMDEPARH